MSRSVLLGILAATVLGTAVYFFANPGDVEPSVQPTVQPAADAPPEAPASVPAVNIAPAQPDGEVELPLAFYQKLPPNSRIPLTIPPGTKSGVLCPDGTFLPLLNGVPNAPGSVSRGAEDGPLPPVVAKRTDADGGEWYEHADGSLTTTRWRTSTGPDGIPRQIVATSHIVPIDESRALPGAPGGMITVGSNSKTNGQQSPGH